MRSAPALRRCAPPCSNRWPPGALVATAPTILFSGIVSGAIAYTIQIFAQAHTPPAEAALILALEGVFAALAGALLLGERLTAIGALGCVLILAGAVAVEIRAAVRAKGRERSDVTKVEKLSLAEARRIALAAQGFGAPRPEKVTAARWLKTVDRLSLHQIDSVNVLVRAHYLPAFSRLGPYDRSLIDTAAWGRPKKRRLFEYWAHEASLLPLSLHPLLRWRMARADRGEAGWKGLRLFAGERRAEAEALLNRIRNEGPRAASDLEEKRGRSGWWEWSDTKQALEWLFWAGHITTATRRGSFERVYDLTERVIPAEILALPTPDEKDAQRALVERAAQALGVATAQDLRDYFRLGPDDARQAIESLVEAGVLEPVEVPGWAHLAYLHRDARRPRRISARALLAPFDPLVWERSRTLRLFDFHYRIEIYTPADKRQHGYYVLPFLLGDRLVARLDLKADRQAGRLLVHAVHLEPHAPSDAMDAISEELRALAELASESSASKPLRRAAGSKSRDRFRATGAIDLTPNAFDHRWPQPIPSVVFEAGSPPWLKRDPTSGLSDARARQRGLPPLSALGAHGPAESAWARGIRSWPERFLAAVSTSRA